MYYYFNIGRLIRAYLDPIIETPLFHCILSLYIISAFLVVAMPAPITFCLFLFSFPMFLIQNGAIQLIVFRNPANRAAYEQRLHNALLRNTQHATAASYSIPKILGTIRYFTVKTIIGTLSTHFPIIPPAGYRHMAKTGIICAGCAAGGYAAGEGFKAYSTVKTAQLEHDTSINQAQLTHDASIKEAQLRHDSHAAQLKQDAQEAKWRHDAQMANIASNERIKMAELAKKWSWGK